jgi:tRNA(fMet)-specific endonuclease VapC
LQQIEVVPVTLLVADRFGVVKAQLRARGKLKADFDLVIAATALELGATLVTNDGPLLSGDIEGLFVDNWLA